MMIVTKFPTFLLRSSHSGRKFIEGRAPLVSFDGWRGRSTAGPTSLPPGVLSFLSEAREVSGSATARLHHAARRRGSKWGFQLGRFNARADCEIRKVTRVGRLRVLGYCQPDPDNDLRQPDGRHFELWRSKTGMHWRDLEEDRK